MNKIKYFFNDPGHAAQQYRSRAGLLVSILIAPLLLGVLACGVLQVPIGDPEKSRVDPAMSGIWLLDFEGETEDWLIALEPYDKRTWLVTWAVVEEAANEDEETADDQAASEMSSLDRLLEGGYTAEAVMLHKGWLTKIKGVRFMVWQPLVSFSEEHGMDAKIWWVQRVVAVNSDYMETDFINSEFEDIGEVDTRREAEKLIRRHLDDPELFMDDDIPVFQRVPQANYDLIAEMLGEAGVASSQEDM